MTTLSAYSIPGINNYRDPISLLKQIVTDFNVTWEFITSDSRKKEVLMFRQPIQTILSRNTNMCLREIGEVTAGRNHCTVLYSKKVIEQSEYLYNRTRRKNKSYLLYEELETKFLEMSGGRFKYWPDRK